MDDPGGYLPPPRPPLFILPDGTRWTRPVPPVACSVCGAVSSNVEVDYREGDGAAIVRAVTYHHAGNVSHRQGF